MKTVVLIPAYNEATTVARVIDALLPSFPVVVIDDGSTDETAQRATAHGATVLRHVLNRGLGAALRTGFLYACENKFDAVVTIDADDQHDHRDVPRLVQALMQEGVDMVIGVRTQTTMPIARRVYNFCGTAFTALLFGSSFTDSQSGLRAIRIGALQKMRLTTSRMEISSELIAEAHRHALVVFTLPITIRYTSYSMSKGQGFLEGMRTAWRLLLRSFS